MNLLGIVITFVSIAIAAICGLLWSQVEKEAKEAADRARGTY